METWKNINTIGFQCYSWLVMEKHLRTKMRYAPKTKIMKKTCNPSELRVPYFQTNLYTLQQIWAFDIYIYISLYIYNQPRFWQHKSLIQRNLWTWTQTTISQKPATTKLMRLKSIHHGLPGISECKPPFAALKNKLPTRPSSTIHQIC